MATVTITTTYESAELKERNLVLATLATYPSQVAIELYQNKTFLAGLDGIDPMLPCFVKEAAVRDVIAMGLIRMMDTVKDIIDAGLIFIHL
jgi:hypothetical protein